MANEGTNWTQEDDLQSDERVIDEMEELAEEFLEDDDEEFDIEKANGGFEAYKKVCDWLRSDMKEPLIGDIDEFIELSTPIIEGTPRAKLVVTPHSGEPYEVSIQAGRHYASKPQIDGLKRYQTYEIAIQGKNISDAGCILEYGQLGDYWDVVSTTEIFEGENGQIDEYHEYNVEDPEKWYVLENVTESEIYSLINFYEVDSCLTSLNMLISVAEQLKELGHCEESETLTNEINEIRQFLKEQEETKKLEGLKKQDDTLDKQIQAAEALETELKEQKSENTPNQESEESK